MCRDYILNSQIFELRSMLCCIVSIMVHGHTGSWQLPPLWTKVNSAGQMCVDCNDTYGATGYRCQATTFPFPCKQRAYSPGLCWGQQGETSLYVCEQKVKKRCSNEFSYRSYSDVTHARPFFCLLSPVVSHFHRGVRIEFGQVNGHKKPSLDKF